MDKFERQSKIDGIADAVLNYLEAEGAVRMSRKSIRGFKTVWQICEDVKFDYGLWSKVKTAINRRGQEQGFSLCYIQGKGHYKGYAGEDITNVLSKYKVAKGWERQLKTTREVLAHCSKTEKFWIEQRDKDFIIEEAEVKYA